MSITYFCADTKDRIVLGPEIIKETMIHRQSMR